MCFGNPLKGNRKMSRDTNDVNDQGVEKKPTSAAVRDDKGNNPSKDRSRKRRHSSAESHSAQTEQQQQREPVKWDKKKRRVETSEADSGEVRGAAAEILSNLSSSSASSDFSSPNASESEKSLPVTIPLVRSTAQAPTPQQQQQTPSSVNKTAQMDSMVSQQQQQMPRSIERGSYLQVIQPIEYFMQLQGQYWLSMGRSYHVLPANIQGQMVRLYLSVDGVSSLRVADVDVKNPVHLGLAMLNPANRKVWLPAQLTPVLQPQPILPPSPLLMSQIPATLQQSVSVVAQPAAPGPGLFQQSQPATQSSAAHGNITNINARPG